MDQVVRFCKDCVHYRHSTEYAHRKQGGYWPSNAGGEYEHECWGFHSLVTGNRVRSNAEQERSIGGRCQGAAIAFSPIVKKDF